MNNLIVLSGASGAGKSTLIRRLRERHPRLRFSVSHTTRPPRAGEIDGREYHFIDEQTFRAMIAAGGFVEWAEVHGKYYGTSWAEVREKSSGSDILLLDIDVQGAANIKKAFPEAWLVFILPPSLDELARRLHDRKDTPNEAQQQRLENALGEIRQAVHYDFIIVNDTLERADHELESIFVAFCQAAARRRGVVAALLGEAP